MKTAVVDVVLFNPHLTHVATGFCPHGNVRKFFSGPIHDHDIQQKKTECIIGNALKILEDRAGVVPEDVSAFKITYERKRVSRTKEKSFEMQYFVIAVLNKEISLPEYVKVNSLDDRKFIPVEEVIDSWNYERGVLKKVGSRTIWSGGDVMRTSPYQVIGLTYALSELRTLVGNEPVGVELRNILRRLERKNISVPHYATEIALSVHEW